MRGLLDSSDGVRGRVSPTVTCNGFAPRGFHIRTLEAIRNDAADFSPINVNMDSRLGMGSTRTKSLIQREPAAPR